MKKILVMGDLHGKTSWIELKSIFKDFDFVIFLSDYFDSFNQSSKNQIKCFKMVLGLIKKNSKKFIGLLGNHDMHYIKELFNKFPYQCSGFQPKHFYQYHSLLKENLKWFKIAFQIEDYLFSHAGVTKSLFDCILDIKKNKPYEDIIDEMIENQKFDDLFNFCLFELNLKEIHFCSKDRNGHDPFSGLYWTGLKELENDNIQLVYPNLKQVVGHTRVSYPYKSEKNNFFFDCLNDEKNEIVKIENLYVIV